MKVEINSPQINALRVEIEKRIGKINGHDRLAKLETLIEDKCTEHVSISTLERLWGYSTRNAKNVSESILNVLARYVDAESWEDFCTKLESNHQKHSELFKGKNIIDCKELSPGTMLRLKWNPDRVCDIEYLGDYRFVAKRTENASIRPGDTFRCLQIERGRELYMDCFTRQGEPENNDTRYLVGKTNGLTSVEFINDDTISH